MTNLPAFLQAQLCAFYHTGILSISVSTAKVRPRMLAAQLREVSKPTLLPADGLQQSVSPPGPRQTQIRQLTCCTAAV